MVAVVVMAAEEDTVVGDLVEAMQVGLVAANFMAEALEVIPLDSLVDAALVVIMVVDGTEGATIMEYVAITRTEDMPIPTTLTGIGLRSVILMAGATESGSRTIIEGEGYFL